MARLRADHAKTEIVVAIGRRIVVAIRRAEIHRIAVPTTTAIHPIRAFRFSNQPYFYLFETITQDETLWQFLFKNYGFWKFALRRA